MEVEGVQYLGGFKFQDSSVSNIFLKKIMPKYKI